MKIILRSMMVALALSTSLTHMPVMADTPPALQSTVQHHRVVFQISDNDAARWRMLLANAKQVQSTFGKPNVDIEIVALGPGIELLRFESVLGDNINQAINNGIHVVACENTMKAKHLTKDDMLPTIGYVASGAVEIIVRQEQGWVYMRP